uniref:Plasma membrane proteolipid 3 n=1 Tax=Steinernema glaseri TaxID=37863 RepID=A0A1I8AK60_9BILA
MIKRGLFQEFGRMCSCLLLVLSVICPPLAVLIDQGCNFHFLINLCLTLIVWIPGVIHAIYVIFYLEDHHYHHHYYHGERQAGQS